jgi:hypothetical protein
VSSNFYWLSTKLDVLDWSNAVRLRTPSKQNADFTGLMQLPKVHLKFLSRSEEPVRKLSFDKRFSGRE